MGQYLRDTFIADLHRRIGEAAPRTQFTHLYLNGVYWGVYDLHERIDEAYAADHFGGSKAEYDVLKHRAEMVVHGSNVAFNELMAIALRAGGLQETTNYNDLSALLDVPAFVDYMLLNIYGGNTDWPHQNWYTVRRATGKFRFLSWDAEHTLKNVNESVLSDWNGKKGEPRVLWEALMKRPEFVSEVQARWMQLSSAGQPFYVDADNPLYLDSTTGNNQPAALYMFRAKQIEAAILLESARWGDGVRAEPYRVADWELERDRLLQSYFTARSGIVRKELGL